jgi:hypothetical protein
MARSPFATSAIFRFNYIQRHFAAVVIGAVAVAAVAVIVAAATAAVVAPEEIQPLAFTLGYRFIHKNNLKSTTVSYSYFII